MANIEQLNQGRDILDQVLPLPPRLILKIRNLCSYYATDGVVGGSYMLRPLEQHLSADFIQFMGLLNQYYENFMGNPLHIYNNLPLPIPPIHFDGFARVQRLHAIITSIQELEVMLRTARKVNEDAGYYANNLLNSIAQLIGLINQDLEIAHGANGFENYEPDNNALIGLEEQNDPINNAVNGLENENGFEINEPINNAVNGLENENGFENNEPINNAVNGLENENENDPINNAVNIGLQKMDWKYIVGEDIGWNMFAADPDTENVGGSELLGGGPGGLDGSDDIDFEQLFNHPMFSGTQHEENKINDQDPPHQQHDVDFEQLLNHPSLGGTQYQQNQNNGQDPPHQQDPPHHINDQHQALRASIFTKLTEIQAAVTEGEVQQEVALEALKVSGAKWNEAKEGLKSLEEQLKSIFLG